MRDKKKLEEEYGKPLYQWNEVVILLAMGENRAKVYCIENKIKSVHRGYYEGKVGGQKKMNRVFDSTAINSTQRFANRMQSGIFPPQRKWCRLEPGPDIPEDRKEEAQAALDIYSDKLFASLKQSNFDIAIGEFLLDLSVGTAVMMVQPGDDVNPLNFIPVPQFLVSFEEGANGQVDNVYRRMRLKGESIMRQWPDANIPIVLPVSTCQPF